MGFRASTRTATVVAALALTAAACGGGSLDGGGDDSDDGSDGSGDDLSEVLGQLGLDADELEGLDLDELDNLDLGALEDFDEGDFGDLGALAEVFGALGLEELIEENADGDVDVEFGEDGFSVESEDGTFSIDEDGSFTVTDDEGQETTGDVDLDGTDGDISIESDDGSMEISSDSELPEEWPADVPAPTDINIQSALTFAEDEGSSIVITGTVDSSSADWIPSYVSQLEDAGFSEDMTMDSGGDVTAIYSNDSWSVVVIGASLGDDTTISVSITPSA